ncbi:ABC transporter ATP-binding protein [Knoellia locipacati]|uniref:ABC transporter ATP-binding protein n=1 Tax=Knoellia locipacati TaxID=882824 RepID=UPI003851483B
MDNVIEIAALRKTFGATVALDGLDLDVAQGEVHGFLGPNGSGKSTTVRVLLGLLRADSGRARLFGQDAWVHATELHRRIAYVPGDVALWPNLTGGEIIDVLARMRGGLDEARRRDLLDRFDLDPSKRSRTYSKGNRQKVAVVAAFASRAELFLLDEPTSGLDPLMEAEFQRCVHEVKATGATVLLSSHILAEAEALSDRLSIIKRGRLVQSGTLADLRHLTRTTVIAETAAPATVLAGMPGVHRPQLHDGRVTFDVDSDHLDGAIAALSGLGLRSLTAHPPTLEELFLRHYGEELPSDTSAATDGAA